MTCVGEQAWDLNLVGVKSSILLSASLSHIAKAISVPEKAVVPMNPGKDSEKLVQCSFILELTTTFKSL